MNPVDASDRLRSIVSSFATQRVLVLGDAILDEYLSGDCSRISPEAPVPVVRVLSARRVLGGAANTAANVAALGAKATLVALIGEDDAGSTLADCAHEAGVHLRAVASSTGTLRKTRVVGQHQQIVRLDYEDPAPPDGATDAAVLNAFEELIGESDIVVMSDYAKGFFSEASAQAVIARAHAAGRLVIVDPRPEHRAYYHGCDYITPNWRESRGLLGLSDGAPIPDAVNWVRRELAAALGSNVVLTLGPEGIAFCSRTGDELFSMPTLAREVFDVSGAGDTVVATLALGLASGADHPTALELANRAASVVVAKFGTATLTCDELLGEHEGHRLLPRRALEGFAATMHAKGKRLVAVTGTFDTLDRRCIQLLGEARHKGDVLIVGLQGDASRSRYCNSRKLVTPQHERAEMLLSLRSVDFVYIWDEPDPTAFLRSFGPDVHVIDESEKDTAVGT